MSETQAARTRDGRVLDKRGAATRTLLLKAAEVHLESMPWRQVSVTGIARLAGVAPATAWLYFAGAEDIALTLAAELTARREAVPEHLERVVDLLAFEAAHLGAVGDA